MSAAFGFGDRPRRLRGREARLWDARAAQEAAIQAFYRMDRSQRDTAVQVETYAGVERDPAVVDKVRGEFGEVSAAADGKSRRYLATLDLHQLDDDADSDALRAAEEAFRAAAADLDATASDIEAFVARHTDRFARIGQTLNRLRSAAGEATNALTEARAAVQELTEAGMEPGAAGEQLAEAERAGEVLAAGPGASGIDDCLAAADRVRSHARRAATMAAELPRRREQITRRLTSLRTRRDALAHRAESVPATLSELRRGYAEGCWADLDDVPQRVRETLAGAEAAMARGERAARQGHWDEAAGAVADTNSAMDSADAVLAEVAARPDRLAEARRDPQAQVAAARFTVRDAQRLVMEGRSLPPAPWAGRLDALAARLDRAQDGLQVRNPNYWAFLTELSAIREETDDLVQQFRSDPRESHRARGSA